MLGKMFEFLLGYTPRQLDNVNYREIEPKAGGAENMVWGGASEIYEATNAAPFQTMRMFSKPIFVENVLPVFSDYGLPFMAPDVSQQAPRNATQKISE